MRNIFIEKSYTKCGGETSSRPFSEKLKLSLSLNYQPKVLGRCFYCMASWGLSKCIETKLQTTCFHVTLSLFKKSNKGLELVSLPYFLQNFWRKIFLLLYSINWPNFIVWLPLLCEILGNTCIAIVCKPGRDVMNFEVTLILRIKPFFPTWP